MTLNKRLAIGGLAVATLLMTIPQHARAADPTVLASGAAVGSVNGITAIPGKVLFTKQDSPHVYQVDPFGVVSLYKTIDPTLSPDCSPGLANSEEYLTNSPGLPGFPLNDVYLSRYGCIFHINADGSGSATLFAHIAGQTGSLHTGINFDRVGTFGNNLIMTFQDGTVYQVSSAGVFTLIKTIVPASALSSVTEGPDVASNLFLPAPGKLLVAQEDQNRIVAIDPGTFAQSTISTLANIESVHVIPPLVCSLGGATGSQSVFFTTDEAGQRILGFDAAAFSAVNGVPGINGILLPGEFPPPTDPHAANSIARIANDGTVSVFEAWPAVAPAVHEGSTFVKCNPTLGCTLTQGYWKNHPSAWPVTSLTLGTVNYTEDQLIQILKTPVKGNGLVSLAHQLIAAKLNIAKGASVPAAVTAAITAADALIGSKVIPPIGNGSVSTSSVATLVGILDDYNNGLSAGGPGHCGDIDNN